MSFTSGSNTTIPTLGTITVLSNAGSSGYQNGTGTYVFTPAWEQGWGQDRFRVRAHKVLVTTTLHLGF